MIKSFLKCFPIWWCGMVLLVGLHQILQWVLKIRLPLIDAYLDALLFMPITLHLLRLEQRHLFNKGAYYELSTLQLLGYWALLSFIAEVLFPYWHPGFVADIFDVICYAIGVLIFVACRRFFE